MTMNSESPARLNFQVGEPVSPAGAPAPGFLLYKNTPGILVIDEKQRIVSANPAICHMLGYETHELVGSGYERICPPESAAADFEGAQVGLPAGWAENEFIGKDSRPRRVSLLNHRIDGKDSAATWKLILVEDPVRRSVSAFGMDAETVLRLIPGHIWSLTVDTETLRSTPNYYSPEIDLILGREPVYGQDISLLEFHSTGVHPDDVPVIQGVWQKTVAEKTPLFHVDYRIRKPDESVRWVRDIVRVTWLNEKMLRLDGVMIDTSEAKIVETELKRRDEILTALGEAAKILLEPTDWDSGINAAIASLGKMMKASHVRVIKNWYDEDEIITSLRYEWTNGDSVPALQNPHMLQISFNNINDAALIQELTDNRVYKGLTRNISSPGLRKTLQTLDVVSMLLIPIYLRGGRWWGVLMFDHCRDEREWTFDEEDSMKTAADMLGSAMIRRRSENELRSSQERYRTLVDLSPYAVMYVDLEWQIMLVNAQAASLFGYAGQDDMVGKNWMDLLDVNERQQVTSQTVKLLDKGELRNLECYCVRQPGTRFPAEISISLMRNPVGGLSGFICIHHDISERKIAQTALTGALNQVNGYVQLLKLRNHVNNLFAELMNRLQSCATPEDIYALTGDYMEKIFPEHIGALYIFNDEKNLFEAVMGWGEHVPGEVVFPPEDCWAVKQKRTHFVSDMQTRLRCRHVKSPSYICAPLVHHDEITGILHMQDITESPSTAWKQQMLSGLAESIALAIANLRLRQKLELQSTHDYLTGLYNLRYMESTAEIELQHAARQQTTLCLVLFDINHFKTINDLYGHKVGDEVLQSLGQILQSRTRPEDTLCRYGGDEFLLIMPEISPQDGLLRAQEMCNLSKEIKFENGSPLQEKVSFTFGLAAYPRHGKTMDELIRAADSALSRRKRDGLEGGLMADSELPV